VKSRRLTTIGLGIVAALSFATAGCAGTTTTTAGTPGGDNGGAAKDPTVALSQAAAELGKTSFAIKMLVGTAGQLTGAMDPQKKQGHFTLDMTSSGSSIKMESRMVDGEMYIKITMPDSPLPGMDGKKWTRVTAGKAAGAMSSQLDASKIAQSLEHAASVERVGDKGFKGTIDITKATESLSLKSKDLGALGEKAKAVPFEATVDDKGRLAHYKINMPAIGGDPAQALDITYSDFGTKVDVTAPPASEVIEKPGS